MFSIANKVTFKWKSRNFTETGEQPYWQYFCAILPTSSEPLKTTIYLKIIWTI